MTNKPGRKPLGTVADIDAQIEALKLRRTEMLMAEGRKIVEAAQTSGLLDLKLPESELVRLFCDVVTRCQSTPRDVAKSAAKTDKPAAGAEARRAG
jgi:TraC-like protein